MTGKTTRTRRCVPATLAVVGLAVSGLAAAGPAAAPAAAASGAGRVTGAGRVADAAARADAALRTRPDLVPGATAGDLDRGQVLTDPDGAAHVRYTRRWHGLPVIGGDIVLHLDSAGAPTGVSGTLTAALPARTTPAVSPVVAARLARAQLTGVLDRVGTPQLVIDATGARPGQAWQVEVTGTRPDQTPADLTVLIDSTTGAVRATTDRVETATGTGNSIYSGQVAIGTTGLLAVYALVDLSRGDQSTSDMQGGTAGPGIPFVDTDDIWGDGTAGDRASAGVDAHYGAQVTWDFYRNVLGRNGIADDGAGYPSKVHYGNDYENAFWNGSSMTYGDGYDNKHPLTALDVAGHEMSHGVTQRSANLVYSGESGGLNEATSDIFGTGVEFYADNAADPGDYEIGEKLKLGRQEGALRYLDRPSRDGHSPDCWSAGIKNLDVHYSSGPANHLFYLLSEGSGAKTVNGVSYNSPTCDGSTLVGIGRDAATKIWYRALTAYMNSGTTYATARTAAVRAALDLYGAGSAQCAGVEKAFTAILVSAGATCANGGTGTGYRAMTG